MYGKAQINFPDAKTVNQNQEEDLEGNRNPDDKERQKGKAPQSLHAQLHTADCDHRGHRHAHSSLRVKGE